MKPMPRWADRSLDAPAKRPANLVHGPDDRPGALQSLLLACQQLGLQSIYWLIPALAASAFGLSGAQAMTFVCLTLVGNAVGALLHGMQRGPVGSGYALPNIPTPVFLSAYLAAAGSQAGLAGAGAALIAAAVLALLLFCLMPRLLGLIPPELTGVVVLMIGVSLLPKAGELALRDVSRGLVEQSAVVLILASLAVMVVVATVRWPLARFAVILGGAIGVLVAYTMFSVQPATPGAAWTESWFALPEPVPPAFESLNPALFLSFFISTVCCVPSWLGDMLTYQRGINANWTRPDMAPLRRGVIAGFLANAVSGLIGGFAGSSSSACVGLSVATRSFSRRAAFVGAGILLIVACSPRLVAGLVQLPGPVAAAMLIFVSSSMLIGGATLIATRTLDARRSACAGLGVVAGLFALGYPEPLSRYLPGAFLAPVTLAFLTTFLLHLCTLPLVRRRLEMSLALKTNPGIAIDEIVEQAAGAWALQRRTADAISHASLEVCEILAERGLASVRLLMRADDGLVRVRILHDGPVLPKPALRPDVEDILGEVDKREAYAMWLAAREAMDCHLRLHRGQASVEFEYRD